MSAFNTTQPVSIPTKREMYTVYAGFNPVELGHLFVGSAKATLDDRNVADVPDNMLRLHGIFFDDTEKVKENYYTKEKKLCLCVEVNPDVVKAWEDFTKSALSTISINYNADKDWFVQVSVEGMSNYTIGKLTTDDVRTLITEAGLTFPEYLTKNFG